MKLVRTIARRSLFSRPTRTLFSIVGIAVGIAIVVGIFTLDYNTILGLSTPGRPEWKAEIRVTPSKRIADPQAELEKIPGVESVTPFLTQDVMIVGAGTESEPAPRVRLFAVDSASAESFKMFRLLEGTGFAGDLKPAVLVGAALAQDLRLEIGSALDLSRPPKAPHTICVDGERKVIDETVAVPPKVERFFVAGILAPENVGRQAGGRLVLVDHADATRLFDGLTLKPEYIVKKEKEADIEKLSKSLGTAWSYDIDRSVIVGQAADERAFRNGVRFAGLLALVLGLFVIFHTLSIALLERMKEIGTLHALGATRGQIARIFFTEALVVATGGAAAGLAGGIGIAKYLLDHKITTLGAGKSIRVFEIPWPTVIPLVVLGSVIALLGSVYPLLRMREASSVMALRGETSVRQAEVSRGFRVFSAILLAIVLPSVYFTIVPLVGERDAALRGVLLFGAFMLALLVGLPLIVPRALGRVATLVADSFRRAWPLSGQMVARGIEDRPARLSVAIIVVAMVAAAYTSLKGMTSSLRAESEEWADTAVVDRVFVTMTTSEKISEIKTLLRELPYVVSVEGADMRTYSPFLIVGIDGEEAARKGPLQSAAKASAFRNARSIILTQRIAKDLDYTLWSKVPILTGRGVVEDYEVIAIEDDYGYFPEPDERFYGVIDSEWMRKDFCIDPESCTRFSVRLADGKDSRDAAREIADFCAERFPRRGAGFKVVPGVEVRDFVAFDIDRDFTIFDVILLMTAILAGVGVLNGQLLSAAERTKEIGILRALGASGRQIGGMVALENLVVGMLGGGLGIILGILVTPVVIDALATISAFDLPYRTAGIHILVAFGGALLVTQLAGLYPIRRMKRTDAGRAIREG